MTHRRGKLYVLEGCDGVGKTTLANAFASALSAMKTECLSLSFPGRTPRTLGSVVYELHHRTDGMVSSVSNTSLQTLHVAAHIDLLESTLLPALHAGKTVVLDRFWWSVLAYGSVAGVPSAALKLMVELEQQVWGKYQPDAVFLVRRDVVDQRATDAHRKLHRAYESIARQQMGRYAVHQIANDDAVPAVVLSMLRLAGIEEAQPDASIGKAQQFEGEVSSPKQAKPKRGLSDRSFLPAKPTVVFDTYWRFAAERQSIFFRRLAGLSQPWTSDPILIKHKFTNVYRASDRVSQYLIRHVIYSAEHEYEDAFFRILLFKVFNKIETWELLENAFGGVSYREFSIDRYDRVLSAARRSGHAIYSGAYIMPSGGGGHASKHRMHLGLLDQMMRDELPEKAFGARSLQAVFELLKAYPTMGDFLAYQYAIDLNYSRHMSHSENDFVIPGPGARDGLRKCFSDMGGLNEAELIRFVADRQDHEFERLGVEFMRLGGRPLQLIDCQNLFCEVDKYSRVRHPEFSGHTGRTRIKQVYHAQRVLPTPWYPPKWGINEAVAKQVADGMQNRLQPDHSPLNNSEPTPRKQQMSLWRRT
jgi:thymidylate kinase